MNHSASSYTLGHSAAEYQRLMRQADFFGDLTEDVFRRAGLEPGMRVLDVGCGVGDVSFLAARLVGSSGSVVGIDRDPEALAMARERAAAAALANVRFDVANLADLEPSGLFDAVVGRLILMYLPDVPGTLRRLARAVRPRGLLVFQEMVMSVAQCVPPVPLGSVGLGRIRETFLRAGFEIDMGAKLHARFLEAGLPAPEMLMNGRIEGRVESAVFETMAGVIRSLLPMMERLGVACPDAVEIDTFAERLRREVLAANAVVLPPAFVGAWARLP